MNPREIDTLVAEKVIGLKPYQRRWTNFAGIAQGYTEGWIDSENREIEGNVPDYSTNIAAAWEVVEKLKERNLLLEIAYKKPDHVICRQYVYQENPYALIPGQFDYQCAPTAPMAICLAALEAVGVKVE